MWGEGFFYICRGARVWDGKTRVMVTDLGARIKTGADITSGS